LADPDFQWCDSLDFLPGVELKINVSYGVVEKEIKSSYLMKIKFKSKITQ